jgi:predicted permease
MYNLHVIQEVLNMFETVLVNVIVMLVYMSFGFIICKSKKGHAEHAKTLSSILIYIFSPAMIINSFLQLEYTLDTLKEIGFFFLVTLVIQLLFFIILYSLLKNKYDDAKYRILTVASILGNVGYFGMPLITSLYPSDPIVACYSSAYIMSMNILIFSIGVFLITNNKKYISIKEALINPSAIALYIALPLFIFNVNLGNTITTSISLLAKMVTPICMIVLGMRLSTVKFKSLFNSPFVYVTSVLKLIAFPLFAYLCVMFLPVSDTFKVAVFVLSSAPSGAAIVSLSEIHNSEQKLCASAVLLTYLLSVISMPLLLLIL